MNFGMILILVLLGLALGSFLNVVASRLPLMKKMALSTADAQCRTVYSQHRLFNLLWPPSVCLSCARPIRPWHNIPLLSWLLLRGKARCCGAPFSIRYLLLEMLIPLLLLAVWLLSRGSWSDMLLVGTALGLGLVTAVNAIECETVEAVPHQPFYVLLWLGLLANGWDVSWHFVGPLSSLFCGLGIWILCWFLVTPEYRSTSIWIPLAPVFPAWFGHWGLLCSTLIAAAICCSIAPRRLILIHSVLLISALLLSLAKAAAEL